MDPTQYISFCDYSIQKNYPAILAFLFIGLIDVSGVIFGMASLAKLVDNNDSTGTVPGAKATFIGVSVSTCIRICTPIPSQLNHILVSHAYIKREPVY